MSAPKNTILVLDQDYEQRVYYTADGAGKGIAGRAHLAWGRVKTSRVLVYRLDEEASAQLQQQVEPLLVDNTKDRFTKVLNFVKAVWR